MLTATKKLLTFFLILTVNTCLAQTDFGHYSSIDEEKLNTFILKEVNKLRDKVKAESLRNEALLKPAAKDHADYMHRRKKLTHRQRKRIKRWPKNRVDYYGEQFERVGENVQVNTLNLGSTPDDKKHPLIHTYEALAKELVKTWKNSPPHYANMIHPQYETTYTAVSIDQEGRVYACQLFGSSPFKDPYREFRDTSNHYKPESNWRCWECDIRPPAGAIKVLPDSSIIFEYQLGKARFHLLSSRMRYFNPWRAGLAADIVLKSQYTCDSSTYFNGKRGVRGIPLKPVYKKDFLFTRLKKTQIYLGKVPDYIDEEFEVNLTVVRNKRTCSNTKYWVIPSEFHVDIPLDFGLEEGEAKYLLNTYDTLTERLYFDKSEITPNDNSLNKALDIIRSNQKIIQHIEVAGYASIEGSTVGNIRLYTERAKFLTEHLVSNGIDSNEIILSAQENFKDFRSDILGTNFESWNDLSDNELKEKLMDKENSEALEFLLKNHRYVELRIITKKPLELKYDKALTHELLKKNIAKGRIKKCLELQRIEFALAMNGEISLEELDTIQIPHEPKFLKLLHDRAVMRFRLDSLNKNALDSLETAIQRILPIKERDEHLNTTLAIIDYYQRDWGYTKKSRKKYFKELKKNKYIDRREKARIILNYASGSDWDTYQATGSHKEKKYYFNEVKKYVKPAKLDVDKTFEIASYYTFFWQYKYAYSLCRRKIDETQNPDDLIFFLKLIHLTDLKLPRKTYLRYFEKVQAYSGEKFCTYFNNPALNFQIFDDQEIREIYCEECGE